MHKDCYSKFKIIQMEIQTTHLIIRRPIFEDILALGNLWRNENVRSFLGGTVSDELISQKLTAIQNHWDLHQFGQWAVIEKNSNLIAGLCGLLYSEDGVEISYMFFPQFWGQGIACEAVIASINYGFKTLQMESIIAITQAANTKSCQLLTRIGMNFIKNFMRFNAIQYLYQITKSDWSIECDKLLTK